MCGRPQAGTMAETEEGIMIDHTNEATDRVRYVPADTDDLRARPADNADGEGRADVAYREIDSPIGRLLLAATPAGLAYVAFEVEDRAAVLDMLATRIGSRVRRVPTGASPALDEAAAQFGQYLAGRRRGFDLPLDTRLAVGFRGEVQRHLVEVAYGQTATYRQLATELDRPGAVRAVGTACATNPLPLVWPCHRILRSDGGLGGYRGGVEAKRRLLAMESAA
jgi:methylated-DNA-[protein]-cysteine S-methyltransferase